VLTGADGLQNPTSLAVRGSTGYIASGAYFTNDDPNVLAARLTFRQGVPARAADGRLNRTTKHRARGHQ
jgi:hypothetical protein